MDEWADFSKYLPVSGWEIFTIQVFSDLVHDEIRSLYSADANPYNHLHLCCFRATEKH